MKTHATPPRSYEFAFPQLDTLVRVDHAADNVLIRATRDSFSAARKECFIHELAAEGFIDEGYQAFSLTDEHPSRPLRWVIDISWLKPDAEQMALTRRFILRVFGGAVLLWLALMVMLLIRAAG